MVTFISLSSFLVSDDRPVCSTAAHFFLLLQLPQTGPKALAAQGNKCTNKVHTPSWDTHNPQNLTHFLGVGRHDAKIIKSNCFSVWTALNLTLNCQTLAFVQLSIKNVPHRFPDTPPITATPPRMSTNATATASRSK